jgi:8-oxo-dGTP pyrophosphatase MutT (NUDIX family)
MNIQRPESKQPIPKDAKKVFDGIVFDVYQWEVGAYDGSKKTFEKIKRADTVGVIAVTDDGQIILSKEEQPGVKIYTGLLGGRVEEGEDVLTGAKRELLEETGYEASEWELFLGYQPTTKIEWAVYTFIARGCKKVAEQNLDWGEKIELQFVSFDEFVELACVDGFGDREIKIKCLEAKFDPEKMKLLKKQIIG